MNHRKGDYTPSTIWEILTLSHVGASAILDLAVDQLIVHVWMSNHRIDPTLSAALYKGQFHYDVCGSGGEKITSYANEF